MNGDVKSPEEGVLTAASVRPATDVLPVVRIRATRSWFDLELRALGAYWELLYFLVWRDIKVRYRQTFIGAGWAMLQPLLTMLIFTAVFSGLANMPSEGVPYPVFAFTGLLSRSEHRRSSRAWLTTLTL